MLRHHRFRFIVCVALILAFSGAPIPQLNGQPPIQVDPLIGIWVGETTFGPVLHGRITIARTGSTWRAAMENTEARFRVTGKKVSFAFPDDQGQFRGTLV